VNSVILQAFYENCGGGVSAVYAPVSARLQYGCSNFPARGVVSVQQKCCILSEMMPQFTKDGLLPPGVHGTDLEELKERMGWSRKRRKLLKGLEEALELMASCGVVRAYLDGSFVTDKDRPNAI
jgi:hypothetical protein